MSFDTLRAVETLEDVGFQARQAKAIVATMNQAFGEQMATKADIAALEAATKADIAALETATKADIAALETATKADIAELKAATKADIAALEAATKADIADLKASTKTGVAGLKADIAELKATLTWRIVLAMGAFAALVRFLPRFPQPG